MKYYIYLPNTNLSIYLDFFQYLKQNNISRAEFFKEYLEPIFTHYKTPHERLFQLLYLIYESIDKQLSIERNFLNVDAYIQPIENNSKTKVFIINDLRKNLSSVFLSGFNTFYNNISYFDLFYLLIGVIDALFQFVKEYTYDVKVSDYIIKLRTSCLNCSKEITFGITPKQLLNQNTIYILPRDKILNIQNNIFRSQYNIKILNLLPYPQTINLLTEKIENIPITVKGNKIKLGVEFRYPTISDIFTANVKFDITDTFLSPDLKSAKTYINLLSILTTKIDKIKDFINDNSISVFNKLERFFGKINAHIFDEIIKPQFYQKYVKYIPVVFIKSFDTKIMYMLNEEFYKIECENCGYTENKLYGIKILDILENLVTSINQKFENKTIYETLKLNIRTEHNFNDFNLIQEIPYSILNEYEKHLDEYRERYLQELKKRNRSRRK